MRDLTAEAIGQLGMKLSLIGTALEITYVSASGVRRSFVKDVRELADATSMDLADDDTSTALPVPVSGAFDLLIIGQTDLPSAGPGGLPRYRQLLVLAESQVSGLAPPNASLFTGSEDLSQVATTVISR